MESRQKIKEKYHANRYENDSQFLLQKKWKRIYPIRRKKLIMQIHKVK